jgi:hypothetical protein
MMGLVDEGDDNGSMIYTLGRGNRFLLRWGTSSDEEKERFREIIIADADEVCEHMRAPRRCIGESEDLWSLKV